jgi:hypothetical protein
LARAAEEIADAVINQTVSLAMGLLEASGETSSTRDLEGNSKLFPSSLVIDEEARRSLSSPPLSSVRLTSLADWLSNSSIRSPLSLAVSLSSLLKLSDGQSCSCSARESCSKLLTSRSSARAKTVRTTQSLPRTAQRGPLERTSRATHRTLTRARLLRQIHRPLRSGANPPIDLSRRPCDLSIACFSSTRRLLPSLVANPLHSLTLRPPPLARLRTEQCTTASLYYQLDPLLSSLHSIPSPLSS